MDQLFALSNLLNLPSACHFGCSCSTASRLGFFGPLGRGLRGCESDFRGWIERRVVPALISASHRLATVAYTRSVERASSTGEWEPGTQRRVGVRTRPRILV